MTDHALTLHFDGAPFTTLRCQDRPCWVAREIGSIIGYAEEGKRLANKITGAWADEFISGRDFQVLVGDELAALKAVVGPDSVPTQAPSLLVLFESGLHLALAKTRMPVGKRLRRFLVDEVLPQLMRTGRYEPRVQTPDDLVTTELVDTDDVNVLEVDALAHERERRLAEEHALRERQFQVGELRQTLADLHQHGRLDLETRLAYTIRCAEMALGNDLPDLRHPAPALWKSPTRIAQELGTTPFTVGFAITNVGLRGDHPGLARAIRVSARHHEGPVTVYQYSPAAVDLIRDELRRMGRLRVEA